MARKAGRTEGRINELAWEVSFGIQSDGIKTQKAVHKSLDIQKVRARDFADIDTKTDIFAEVYELTAEFQSMGTASPSPALKELVEILGCDRRGGPGRRGD